MAARVRPWGAAPTTQRPSSAALAELLGEDGPPASTVALASRLQSYEDELVKEPYFKTRTARAVGGPRPGDGRELATVRKKASAMSADFQRLLSTHERQEAAALDLRQKVRALRQEVEGRDKALELARRTVERLGSDKAQLEAAAAGTQAYVRKLEARLLSVRHAAELEQQCVRMQSELDTAAHALHEAQARAEAAEEAHASAALDAACLRRGLELAAEQMTRSAGAEIPCTLLRAVARGQEEALSLSGQLADAKQQVQQLAAALEQAREHLQAQQTALASQTGGRAELQQRAEAAEAALEKQRAATAELRRVLDALKPKAGSLAAERDDLRQQLELERTAAADAQKDARQLRAALRQKATIEAALRDELRRALAGEGATPSPLSKQAATRAASRAGAPSRLQQQAAQQLPAKRAGSAWPGSKAVMRQTSAWEVPAAGSPGAAIAAEPSPLRRLQQQRQHQHGGRAGEPQQQQEQQRQQREEASWEELLGTWQPQAGAAGIDIGAAQQGDSMLLSPPSSSSTVRRRAAVALEPAAGGLAAAALPAGDARLMQVYSSALDEQIALLEGDLARLPSSPAKQQRQLAAEAKRSVPVGGQEAPGDGIGAGRQGASGGVQEQDVPVPNMWHSNPLAGGSPAKPAVPLLPEALAAPQSADQPIAETVWARPSAPAAQASATAAPAAAGGAADDEDGAWGGSAASSPSLRLPAEAAEPPRARPPPLQHVQPTDSGGAASLSRHWQLPSPGAGNSDWLSNELCEANIEALEVTSSTPLRNPGAGSASSEAQQAQQQPAQQQRAGAGLARPASGGWASSWEEGEGNAPASQDAGHLLRPQPFLPGLPLVADRLPPAAAAAAAGQPAQTLFDLADADFGSDLL